MGRDRMDRFEIFIGVWNTRGDVFETPDSPAGTLLATDTYRWLPGRRFVVHDVDARFGDAPTRSMEVMGFDPEKNGTYFAHSYDDQGVTERFGIRLHGRRWTIDGVSVRFDGRFSEAGDRLTGRWERKVRRAWHPWIDLELTRT